MDLLKTQFERLQRQLAGLGASQKMLVAALAAIMVITIVYWGKYAGDAELVPLLNQSFSVADLGRIKDRLDQKGIHATITGDKLMVPADRRMEILTDLTYSRLMPRSTSEGFEAMLKQMSPFDADDKQAKLWNHGKEELLSQIVSGWPEVIHADVMIDATSISRIEGSIEPAASVNISMQEGSTATQKLVDAAADLVVGSQAGISASRIKVVVNGIAHKVHDSSNAIASGSDQIELLQQYEANAEQRIRREFGDIPGLLVSVTMKLNTTTSHVDNQEYDSKNTVTKNISSIVDHTESNSPAPTSGEGGAAANTGLSVATPSAGTTQIQDKTEDKNTVAIPGKHTVSDTPAGDATTVGASVRVPLSYFARLMKVVNPTTSEPTYAQIRPVIDDELKRMRSHVLKDVGLAVAEDVSMDVYVDAAPTLAVVNPVTSSSFSLMLGGHVKEIALGRAGRGEPIRGFDDGAEIIPGAAPVASDSFRRRDDVSGRRTDEERKVLGSTEALAGDVGSGETLLDAMELNDEAVRSAQMIDQVSTMVKENPDAAAALVKRWLNRS